MELPTCMYRLAPASAGLASPGTMELPTCMYRLGDGGQPQPSGASQPQPGQPLSACELERRQEAMLGQLRQLQDTVNRVRQALGIGKTTEQQKQQQQQSTTGEEKSPGSYEICAARQARLLSKISELKSTLQRAADQLRPSAAGAVGQATRKGPLSLAVRASPSHPPYSLLCLIEHLKEENGADFLVETSTHVHSSLLKPLPNQLHDFLPDSDQGCEDRSKVGLRVTLIWSEVGRDPEMSLGLSTIRGELNIMHYVARVLGLPELSLKSESLLDVCYQDLVWNREKSAHTNVLQLLDQALAKQASVCDGSPSLCPLDFAVYSSLVQLNLHTDPKGGHVKKWVSRCQSLCGRGSTGSRPPASGKDKSGSRWRNRTKSKSKSKSTSSHNQHQHQAQGKHAQNKQKAQKK